MDKSRIRVASGWIEDSKKMGHSISSTELAWVWVMELVWVKWFFIEQRSSKSKGLVWCLGEEVWGWVPMASERSLLCSKGPGPRIPASTDLAGQEDRGRFG